MGFIMISAAKKQAVKQRLTIALFATLSIAGSLFFLSACSSEPDTPLAVEVQDIAINGYDPVSYFTESKPIPGDEKFEYTWNDAKYRFSCQENLERFKTDPAKYAPQYNGFCAFAMSRGDYSRINPEVFAIVDGKLYLTYNRDIRNAWLQDKENYISKADRVWQDSRHSNN